ncbi:DUF3164 family protein [Citrobacter portucalensis]|uniref:DUF3164 family protein n=1 Tax=Citrobacter portucalensis TaxID=1639133 RepID=UPI00226B408A|nr:DUF3164 family protein [Citrobacter portucalensis]MCX9038826.1 DUF3164 family protein [Citrobacter portucalensis]
MSTNTTVVEKQFTGKEAPEGYWIDAKGVLTPQHLIKPIDKARDQLVGELIERALKVNQALAEFKTSGFADIAAFVDLSANEYGVAVGGKKGNVTLYTYDGRYKIQRSMSDRMSFDERIQAAKELIDSCLSDWTEDARPEIRTLINDAFRVDKTGLIRVAEVLKLRRLDINDERWQKAMLIIGEALQLVGTSSYIRVYERVGDSDQYQPIALDIAGV